MRVKYVGKKEYHSDTLFGTGARWNGHGDTQPIASVETAHRMCNNHPDVYKLVSDDAAVKAGDITENLIPQGNEDKPLVDTLTVPEEDGTQKPLSDASFLALKTYVTGTLGSSVPAVGVSKQQLIDHIVQMHELGKAPPQDA